MMNIVDDDVSILNRFSVLNRTMAEYATTVCPVYWLIHILHSKSNNKSGAKSSKPTSSTASSAADTTNARREF
jgi:hypothetical protein